MGVETVLASIGLAIAAAGTAYGIYSSENRPNPAGGTASLINKGTVTGGGLPTQGQSDAEVNFNSLQMALNDIENAQQIKQQNETFTANTESHTALTYAGVIVLGVAAYAIAKRAKVI